MSNEADTINWLQKIAANHKKEITALNYIFQSDESLLHTNIQYLQHDYYTDIITFDYSEHSDLIEGDIFISIDRVKDNSTTHKVTFEDELSRVMAHGLLHLIGFDDKSIEQLNEMRNAEAKALSLR